jgi:opacity protein-like surface antigen
VKKLLVLLLLVSSLYSAEAQDWEAGAWLGMTYSFGDINSEYRFDNPDIGFGIMSRFNFNRRLSLKLSGSFGQTSGSDALSDEPFQSQRNLSFRTNVYDGTVQFEFNFLKYEHGSNEHNFTPYLMGGMSMFWFNPQAEYNGQWVDLQPLGTEGQFRGNEYNLIQPAMAFGGGFKFDITYEWSINLEVSSRFLFTDHFDDVSGLYPDLEDLEESRGPLAVALADRSANQFLGETGRQRGDSQSNDMYVFVGLTLAYNFAAVKCFKFY